MTPLDYSKRTYGLDIFRAVAIILVVHGHASYMLDYTILSGLPWIKLIDGVEFFFVLSGFLIGTILIKEVVKSDFKFSTSQLYTFWKRRWFRTLPNYYLILFANYLVVLFGIIPGDISQFNWKFFFFLHNFSGPFYDFFWESWSLSIEEWFYIFLPFLLLLLLKLLPSRKGILTVIIIMLVVPLLYRFAHADLVLDDFWRDVTFRKVVLMRLDAIVYGVLAAYIKFYYLDHWKKYARPLFIWGIILALTIPYFSFPNWFSNTLGFNLVAISATLLLPLADGYKSFKTNIGKAVTHISLISYSMYLINLGLVSMVIGTNFPIQENATDGLVKYGIYWVIVIVVSSLIFKYFELPFTSLRDKKFFK
jgi:peptidoglycan/LPS O-acetylase OafA/YrhL